jgi:hypothetical protein
MDNQRQAYYENFAKHLAKQMVPSDEIKSFVGSHSTLVGDFAEAQVRKFVRQVVFPLRVSHGAVIAPESYGIERAKQVDTIIWTPNPLPPLFEVDDFALVPWTSSMGILEIKSSAYRDVGKDIAGVLDMECDLTCGRRPTEDRGIPAALGVIVLQKEPISDSKLTELIASGKVVVLLQKEGNNYNPNAEALLRFVNHLAGIRRRALQLADLRIRPSGYGIVRDDSATSL